MKKVGIKNVKSVEVDNWVDNKEIISSIEESSLEEAKEEIRRIVVEVPFAVHRKCKMFAAMEDKTVSDLVRDLLEKNINLVSDEK